MEKLVNEAKKQRAIKTLRDEARARGEDMSTFVLDEAKVIELYVKYGGLISEKEVVSEEAAAESKSPKRGRERKVDAAE